MSELRSRFRHRILRRNLRCGALVAASVTGRLIEGMISLFCCLIAQFSQDRRNGKNTQAWLSISGRHSGMSGPRAFPQVCRIWPGDFDEDTD